ncbi:MAG: aspartyl protease family protein [Acidobacteria bacterium]|nr:aspartyl protease family protein [Acidobacteriota bacterium]
MKATLFILAVSWASTCLAGLPVDLPFTLDHNRLTLDVELCRPNGSRRKARAWLDTGSPGLQLAEPLAREMGLQIPAFGPEGRGAPSTSPAPVILAGGVALDVDGSPVQVQPNGEVRAGVQAEVTLPARVFRNFRMTLDYPARRLRLSLPGGGDRGGAAIPCRVHPDTGMVQVAVTLGGEKVQLAVDTGSAGTWISRSLVDRHSEWPAATGAAGSANFFGFAFEAEGRLVRIPELHLGPMNLGSVGALGLDQRIFDGYSRKTAAPVSGFIGGNILKNFRVEIDPVAQMSWWTPASGRAAEPFDMVGLTLRPLPGGGLMVAGVVQKDGRPCVEGVQPGDHLLQVDSLKVTGASMGEAVQALRGRPGEVRTLLLERDGKPHTVRAKIATLI